MNADEITLHLLMRDGDFWKNCVQDEQQREHYSADIKKISRERNGLRHRVAVPASIPTRTRSCCNATSVATPRQAIRGGGSCATGPNQLRPPRTTSPPRFVGVP